MSAVITFGHEVDASSAWSLLAVVGFAARLRRRIRLGNAEFNHYFAEGKLLPVEARPVPEPRRSSSTTSSTAARRGTRAASCAPSSSS